MSELLQQIDRRRYELGMSKRVLAKRAGVALSTVFRLLNHPEHNCG
jgi:predicted transcriptional regulator